MPVRPLSRRTTVGSALLFPLALPLSLAACDIDPPLREDSSGGPVVEPPEDSALVASAVAALSAAADVVTAAADVSPALAARLDGLARARAAHLDLLAGAVPDAERPTPGTASVPARPAAALVAVRRSEQRLLRTLRDACVAASSGDLARVLASAAASVSQHLTALSPEPAA